MAELAGVTVQGYTAGAILPAAVLSATYNANNQLTQWGSTAMTYDLNGNTLNDGTNAYVWDARNRLVSANSNAASFSYDAFGRRASKSFLSTTTGFLYDGPNSVQEQQGATVTANLLTAGLDERFQRTDATGSYSYLTDALGSTTALTNSTGAEQTTYSYGPYGGFSATGSNTNDYAFTGREADGLGIDYFRARYYNPATGRFLSEDPMGFAGSGPDLYGYAGNNPISYSDPSGLCTDPGGPGVSYCIDTFIPEQSVWGFAGDNRGPDSNGGSYRTQQFLTQNADGSWNSQYFPGTSSLYLAPKISRPAAGDGCGVTPLSGRKNGSNGFRAHCWASDGLGFGAAPDAGYDLDFTPGPGGPNINGMGTQFPSLEIWQYGGPNGPQLVYYYDSQAAGTGPGDLFPTPWSSPLMPIVH